MTIDKQKLQKLLWAEAASFRADCAGWKRNTEALDEFLGKKTLGEAALELLAENEALRQVLAVSHEFILNDARTHHMCDETGQVSPLFPKRVGILAAIDGAMDRGGHVNG
ncbi:hypothetical protein [Pseudomonas shahriarae]|uniref:hypothetical protein n=1 Tax=Pseudomonas shahriarae TaxID=2745512 RepID=UPI00236246B6|nr:hypothetical protein [Pseudomonas shahriarae]MDD1135383.1 hypothetical protein [Pseudomonas shahriarae]